MTVGLPGQEGLSPVAPARVPSASPASAKIAHPSTTERAALGKATRQRLPLDRHADLNDTGRADPIALLESQAASRVPDLVPIRYGRMLVSPFAFYRGAALLDGRGPGDTPELGAARCSCAVTRTCRNFGVYRLAGASAGVRHQRLRRDPAPARSSGTSSGSLPAWPWPAASNGFSTKKRRTRRCSRPSAATARRCASSRSRANLDGLVRPASTWTSCQRRSARSSMQVGPPRREAALDKARSRDSIAGAGQADHDGRRSARGSSATPPLVVPIEELVGRRPTSTQNYEIAAAADPLLPPHPAVRTVATCSSSSSSCRWHARSSASAASAPGPGSCCSRASMAGTRCSCRPRRPRPRCSRGFTRASAFKQPGAARRQRPAAHAGQQRHLPRLAARRRDSTESSATSTSASSATEGLRGRRRDASGRA